MAAQTWQTWQTWQKKTRISGLTVSDELSSNNQHYLTTIISISVASAAVYWELSFENVGLLSHCNTASIQNQSNMFVSWQLYFVFTFAWCGTRPESSPHIHVFDPLQLGSTFTLTYLWQARKCQITWLIYIVSFLLELIFTYLREDWLATMPELCCILFEVFVAVKVSIMQSVSY